MLQLNAIHHGHVLDLLRQLDDESIDCVVTSPPYYGLRRYNTKHQIWDGVEGCEHKWGEEIVKSQTGGDNGINPEHNMKARRFPSSASSCILCGAWKGELGLEPTFKLYIKHLADIFDGVKRILKKTGTCWVVIADTYGGSNCGYGQTKDSSGFQNVVRQGYYLTSSHKPLAAKTMPKSLLQIPSRFAIEMTDRDWILRNNIVWKKPNCMPSSAKDRFTVDFEYVFFFTKSRKYFFEQQFEPVKEASIARLFRARSNQNKWVNGAPGQSAQAITQAKPNISYIYKRLERSSAPHEFGGADHLVAPFDIEKGRNMRAVWDITLQPFKGSHYATFPEKLIEIPIRSGCPVGGLVLDPFIGSGTTAVVARKLGRSFLGFELQPKFVKMANKRLMES